MMDINRQKGELFLLLLILFPLSLNHMLHLVQPVLFFHKIWLWLMGQLPTLCLVMLFRSSFELKVLLVYVIRNFHVCAHFTL